jgi:NAD(P)-dependent dehydrogenase (short-subunit alcohol dehydrogenase family)
MYDLNKKVALVTGAARGIGAAIAACFAEHGCSVVVADVDFEGARASAARLGSRGAAVHIDVRDGNSVREAVRTIVRDHGGIDVLVNNAGVLSAGPFDALSDAQWEMLIGVNLTGSFHCIRAVVPVMLGRPNAAIINIASISAEKGGGVFGSVWYAATKAAIVAITKGLGRELGPQGIRVNAISPGVVDTDMVRDLFTPSVRESVLGRIPLGRLTSVEDIARCAVFLASDDASCITGETVVVDGGLIRT